MDFEKTNLFDEFDIVIKPPTATNRGREKPSNFTTIQRFN